MIKESLRHSFRGRFFIIIRKHISPKHIFTTLMINIFKYFNNLPKKYNNICYPVSTKLLYY